MYSCTLTINFTCHTGNGMESLLCLVMVFCDTLNDRSFADSKITNDADFDCRFRFSRAPQEFAGSVDEASEI